MTFRFSASIPGMREPFVDYAEGATIEQAAAAYREAAAACRFPVGSARVECVQVNPDTLRPIEGAPVVTL